MSRFSQGSVGPRCNRTDSAIQSRKMREYSFKWWWWLIIFLCYHLWQPKKSRKIHSPPVLSHPLWFAGGIWQQVDRVGFRRGQGGPRWCPYRLPSTRGGSLAPRSKCLLVGVECLADKVRPFEASVCEYAHTFLPSKNSCCRPGGSVHWPPQRPALCSNWPETVSPQPGAPASLQDGSWEWVSLQMVQPGHRLDVPSHPHLLYSKAFYL